MPNRHSNVVLALAAAFVFAAGPVAANPLPEELLGLLSTNPEILAAEKQAGASREDIDKLQAEYYPRVRLEGDVGVDSVDSPSTRSGNGDGHRRGRQTATATVTQNLFNGLSTTLGVQIAELNAEIARISLEGTRQNVLMQGITAYLEVQRRRRLIELSLSNQKNIQEQLALEDERVQRGAGIAVDVLQAKSRLQIARERHVSFEGNLKDAISRYIKVFGHAPDLAAMNDPAPPIGYIPPTLEATIDIALDLNPAVVSGETDVVVSRQERERVLSEYFPEIDLVGSWNIEKHKEGVIGTRRDYSVLLQASWDLFTGFSTRASRRKAALEYGASKDNLQLAVRRVVEQTRLSWQALDTSRQRVDLLENAVNIASEVFTARRKLREAGKETVINVLDAESEIFDARINYVNASYDETTSIYQLLLAMGLLNADHLGLNS